MTATGALPRHLFLDANVLFSPVAFDVFLSLAEHGAVEAQWSPGLRCVLSHLLPS